MSNCQRFFLHVVRGQPMIFVSHKGLKESPRAARDDASGAQISGRKFVNLFKSSATNVISDQRRQNPRQHPKGGDGQGTRPHKNHWDGCRKSDRDSRPHENDEGA